VLATATSTGAHPRWRAASPIAPADHSEQPLSISVGGSRASGSRQSGPNRYLLSGAKWTGPSSRFATLAQPMSKTKRRRRAVRERRCGWASIGRIVLYVVPGHHPGLDFGYSFSRVLAGWSISVWRFLQCRAVRETAEDIQPVEESRFSQNAVAISGSHRSSFVEISFHRA